MVGAQLVAGIAQAGVGAPGVAALVAADAGRLALVLVGAGALIVAQPHALRAGASRLAVGHLAPVLTAAVVELAGVRRLAAPPVAAQAVPAGQGGGVYLRELKEGSCSSVARDGRCTERHICLNGHLY